MFRQKWFAAHGSAPENCESFLVCDVNKAPKFAGVAVPDVMPTVTSSCRLWLPQKNRWLMPVELAAMMGFPVTDRFAKTAAVELDAFSSLGRGNLFNAMHVANVGVVLAVALSCTTPI